MPQLLHETFMGKKLFEGDIPQIVQSLNKIAKELERANNLKEAELDLKKQELALNPDYPFSK